MTCDTTTPAERTGGGLLRPPQRPDAAAHQRRAWDEHRHRFVLDVPRRETSTSVAAGRRGWTCRGVRPGGTVDRRDRAGRRGVAGADGRGPTRTRTCWPSRSTSRRWPRSWSRWPRPGWTTSGWSRPTPSPACALLLAGVGGRAVDVLPRSLAQGPAPQAPAAERRLRRPRRRPARARRAAGGWPPTGPTTPSRCVRCWMPIPDLRAATDDPGWAPRPPIVRSPGSSGAAWTPAAGPRPQLPPCRLTTVPGQRWRLDLAYDGSRFSGWAAQAGQRTVQGELELWLARVLRLDEPARLVCAGRTDAGVHARGQVAHLDLPGRRPGRPASLVRRLQPGPARRLAVRRISAGPGRFRRPVRRRSGGATCYRLATPDTPVRPALPPSADRPARPTRSSTVLNAVGGRAARAAGLRARSAGAARARRRSGPCSTCGPTG